MRADVALTLPKVTGRAHSAWPPTTSTTMMLALGDALSVALLERKGFPPMISSSFIGRQSWARCCCGFRPYACGRRSAADRRECGNVAGDPEHDSEDLPAVSA